METTPYIPEAVTPPPFQEAASTLPNSTTPLPDNTVKSTVTSFAQTTLHGARKALEFMSEGHKVSKAIESITKNHKPQKRKQPEHKDPYDPYDEYTRTTAGIATLGFSELIR